ncbi:gamma carbonic anhydrase family protein [Opacimonas viscosa]|mgnify:FL=1|uniref:Gamma carbonic anhydrase family protein n=1 Tax=Opacimonas viscosa TaxID=2961944 RepID=A0AA41WYB5_9ALTE|nr:gamma carbonic anhydrase family protein [Opacimonas viscosa]MCP3428757.1 gamma carbonic anhydrase family protein [Opacimonas viscosa]
MLKPFKGTLPTLHQGAYVEDSAVLYGEIEIGVDASVWPLVAGRGDVNYIKIGDRTNIQDGSILHVSRSSDAYPEGFPLIIGADVTIGHQCMLHGCTIGDRVLVGMGSVVLDGVQIQDDVFIGAGSVVPPGKVLESGYLYVGNPAVQKRPLKDAEIAFLKKSAEHYVLLKDEYMAEEAQ